MMTRKKNSLSTNKRNYHPLAPITQILKALNKRLCFHLQISAMSLPENKRFACVNPKDKPQINWNFIQLAEKSFCFDKVDPTYNTIT